MILTQSDIYCCKASDGAAVGGGMPHNITKPQGAAGVVSAIKTTRQKTKGAAFEFEYSLDSETTVERVLSGPE